MGQLQQNSSKTSGHLPDVDGIADSEAITSLTADPQETKWFT